MPILRRIQKKLDGRLLAVGFTVPVLRTLLLIQAGIAGIMLIAGVLCAAWTLWPLAFALGAALITFAFAHLAYAAARLTGDAFSAAVAVRLFFGFSVRLAVAAFILFLLIVQWKMPLAPLLMGLSLTPVCILVWGLCNLRSYSDKPVKRNAD